jgi:hypothetical protein
MGCDAEAGDSAAIRGDESLRRLFGIDAGVAAPLPGTVVVGAEVLIPQADTLRNVLFFEWDDRRRGGDSVDHR